MEDELKSVNDVINLIVEYNNNIYGNLSENINDILDIINDNLDIFKKDDSYNIKDIIILVLSIYHDNIENVLSCISLKHTAPMCKILQ